jgi:hypothetical protein
MAASAGVGPDIVRRQGGAETRLLVHTAPDVADIISDLNTVPETLSNLFRQGETNRCTVIVTALISKTEHRGHTLILDAIRSNIGKAQLPPLVCLLACSKKAPKLFISIPGFAR